ncbi:hypothetical protein ABK040_011397 [Willaertia magna]
MITVIISETGQTYDRKEIEEWLKSKNTCPSTGIKLKSKIINSKLYCKVTKNIKMWSVDVNLFEICLELINESLDLIKNDNNFKNYQDELNNLQFNILLNEKNEDKLFNNYMKPLNELKDLQFKLFKFSK